MITGGAGFIGSHVVRLFVNTYPDYHVINLDKLTYAGNLANLRDVEDKPNYTFVKGDICDYDAMLALMRQHSIDGIIHLAAESHVDRSIKDGRSACCKRRKSIGSRCPRGMTANVSTTYPPTRSTGRWN